VADPFSEFSGTSGDADLENWWPESGSGALRGADAFEAMTAGDGTSEAEEAGAELAAVEMEDEMQAVQELSEVEEEAATLGDGGEASLDALLAVAKARPGLKITFSY
jgi:hypothetical protein